MAQELTVITDTREQNELDFSGFRGVAVSRQGLKTGDYSIQGYEHAICFERKAVGDAVSTLVSGHERFLREMERMRDFEERYILIVCNTAGKTSLISLFSRCWLMPISITSAFGSAKTARTWQSISCESRASS